MYQIWIALYSLLDPIKFSLVGSAKLNEIFIIVLFPFIFKIGDLKKFPYYKKVIYCLSFLLAFSIITDLVVIHSELESFLKGWASIIVSIISFAFFFKVFKSQKLIAFFLFFSIFRTIISPADDRLDSEMSYFKFYISPILTACVLYGSYALFKRHKTRLVVILFICYSLISFSYDSRSVGLIFMLSAILIFIFSKRIKFSFAKSILFGAIFTITFIVLYFFYASAVLNGQLGGEHSQSQIRKLDNPYNPLELLLIGRGEIYGASVAISDNPIFGHGSWALDKNLHYSLIEAQNSKDDDELQRLNSSEEEHIIPSHSVFTGAWVNYGIGGILCVLLLFIYLIKMGSQLIRNAFQMAIYPIIVVTTIEIVWTFLFSPFQHLRYDIPQMGGIILASYYLFNVSTIPKQPLSISQ